MGLGSRGQRSHSQRGSPEAGVAGPGPAEERNNLLELGNGDVSNGGAIHFHFHGLVLLVLLLLGRLRQEPYQLLDALEPRSRFLHRVLF